MPLPRKMIMVATAGAALASVLFYPPMRDRFFATKLWPWSLPWDVTEDELSHIQALSQPGDIVVESNLHGWQWMALSLAATGTSWVHGALVDENKRLLTVHVKAIEADWSIYHGWGSTRLALLRPPYQNAQQAQIAIDYARNQLGTSYDPSFRNHNGNCNGLVASALVEAGLPVKTRNFAGRQVYPANCFFAIPEVKIVWSSRIPSA